MSSRPPAPRGRLVELAASDLGLIEHLSLVLGPGMTALTGETGAGKTMVIGAIDLLLGGRADSSVVRAGGREAVVEGRFEVDGEELILTRVVPVDGRSRAYIDGRMASAGALAERTASLVDLHGQHAHQSLLAARVQREALDRFAGTDLRPLTEARARRRHLEAELESLGGDEGARRREADLLQFQLDELDAAALTDAEEDRRLDAEEDLLGGAVDHRDRAAAALAALSDEGAAIDGVGAAVGALDGRQPFAEQVIRLRGVQADLDDLVAEIRHVAEQIDDDPARLEAIRQRRQLLADLRRKYGTATVTTSGPGGSGSLADVIAYRSEVAARLDALASHHERAEQLAAEIRGAEVEEARLAADVAQTRRRAAPELAAAVEANLAELAMGSARFGVEVGPPDPGDDVVFLLAANRGAPAAPLARVASGGELARTMLALRLVLSAAPDVLVFDEVDAGIGGAAALAVGRSLAQLGRDHQVLVVTHLPQVAAFADQQVHVAKQTKGATTTTSVRPLGGDDRVVELSRMLAGTPDSEATREAAADLLARAGGDRASGRGSR